MRCRVLHMWVPYDVKIDDVVKLCTHNGVKVDDCCSASSRGRLVGLWVDERDFDPNYTKFEQHVGRFWE